MAEFKKIEGTSPAYFVLVIILAIIAALGVYGYYLEHTIGGFSDMGNRVPWGVVNACIPYYIGLSAGSLIISALAGVFNIREYKIFSRMAAFLAAAWIIVAMLSIVFDVGMLWHFGNAIRYFNPTSIFSWNAFLYSSYFVICAIYLIAQFEEKERAVRFLAGLAVFWAVLVHSGTGAIYGFIYSRELYHSALTAPMFIICAITSGLGLLIATIYLTFRFTNRELSSSLVQGLAKIFAGLALVLLYFLTVEGLEKGYIPALHNAIKFVFLNPSESIFWSFWLLIFIGILLPVGIVFCPKTGKDMRWLALGGIIHAAMVFAERFYLIIPGEVYPREYLPGYKMISLHTLEGQIVTYTPTPIEWIEVIGLFAIGYLIYVIGVKFFAIVPERAVEEEVEE